MSISKRSTGVLRDNYLQRLKERWHMHAQPSNKKTRRGLLGVVWPLAGNLAGGVLSCCLLHPV